MFLLLMNNENFEKITILLELGYLKSVLTPKA